MISLLHPSRGRPQQAYDTAKKWIEKAGQKVEYILSVDNDEAKLYEPIFLQLHKDFGFCVKLIANETRSAVGAINGAAMLSVGDILMVLSDDFDCFDNWGVALLKELEGKEDFILKTQDGIQDWIITMPIMDRKYYNRFGYVYYPEFRHMFCDTFLTCVADLTGRKIESNLLFKHNHYSIAGGKDSVSERADKTWEHGEKLFLELARKNYLLKPDQIKGKIKSETYSNWIKQRI